MHPDDPEQYRIPPGYPAPAAPPPYAPPPGYPQYAPAPGYPPYAAPGYPPSGYPLPGSPVPYGAAPWNAPQLRATWPHGSDRPGTATAAAVLGFVTGGLTALASLFWLFAVLGGTDLPTGLLALGLPCAGALIYGGVGLLRRDSAAVLVGACLAAVAVLLVALAGAAATYDQAGIIGFGVFAVLAAVLPIVTGSLALSGPVRGWLSPLD